MSAHSFRSLIVREGLHLRLEKIPSEHVQAWTIVIKWLSELNEIYHKDPLWSSIDRYLETLNAYTKNAQTYLRTDYQAIDKKSFFRDRHIAISYFAVQRMMHFYLTEDPAAYAPEHAAVEISNAQSRLHVLAQPQLLEILASVSYARDVQEKDKLIMRRLHGFGWYL